MTQENASWRQRNNGEITPDPAFTRVVHEQLNEILSFQDKRWLESIPTCTVEPSPPENPWVHERRADPGWRATLTKMQQTMNPIEWFEFVQTLRDAAQG